MQETPGPPLVGTEKGQGCRLLVEGGRGGSICGAILRCSEGEGEGMVKMAGRMTGAGGGVGRLSGALVSQVGGDGRRREGRG